MFKLKLQYLIRLKKYLIYNDAPAGRFTCKPKPRQEKKLDKEYPVFFLYTVCVQNRSVENWFEHCYFQPLRYF